MSPQDVMLCYQEISRLMGEMVAASQARDWDALRELESRCRPLTHRLMAEEAGVELPDAFKRAKFELLRKVLDDDAAIRAVTQPWMAELQQLIGNVGARRKLNRAYGAGVH